MPDVSPWAKVGSTAATVNNTASAALAEKGKALQAKREKTSMLPLSLLELGLAVGYQHLRVFVQNASIHHAPPRNWIILRLSLLLGRLSGIGAYN